MVIRRPRPEDERPGDLDFRRPPDIMRVMNKERKIALSLTIILAVAAAVFLADQSVAAYGGKAPAGDGVLSGTVTRGPVSPVQRPGESSSKPASGVMIIFRSPEGEEVASTVTGGDGRYRVNLPPGTYRVEVPRTRLGLPKGLPREVAVSEGKETSLDIYLDTGIR